ncbi:hypothetical protein ABK040_010602 [Willaertia magna]
MKLWNGLMREEVLCTIHNSIIEKERDFFSVTNIPINFNNSFVNNDDVNNFVKLYSFSLMEQEVWIPRFCYFYQSEWLSIDLSKYSEAYFSSVNDYFSLKLSFYKESWWFKTQNETKKRLEEVYKTIQRQGFISFSIYRNIMKYDENRVFKTRDVAKYFMFRNYCTLLDVVIDNEHYFTWRLENEIEENIKTWLTNLIKFSKDIPYYSLNTKKRKQTVKSIYDFGTINESCSEENEKEDEIIELTINENCSEENEKEDEIIELTKKALLKNKLEKSSFPYIYWLTAMKLLNLEDTRGMRWPTEIILFCQDLIFYCGRTTYECILKSVELNTKTLQWINTQHWKTEFNGHVLCTNDLEGFFGQSKTHKLMKKHTCFSYTKAFESIRQNYLIKHSVNITHNNNKRTTIDENCETLVNCDTFLNLIYTKSTNNKSFVVYDTQLEEKIFTLIQKYKIAKTLSLRESYHKPQYLSQNLICSDQLQRIEGFFNGISNNFTSPLVSISDKRELSISIQPTIIQNEILNVDLMSNKYFGKVNEIKAFKRESILQMYIKELNVLIWNTNNIKITLEAISKKKTKAVFIIDKFKVTTTDILEISLPHTTTFKDRAVFYLIVKHNFTKLVSIPFYLYKNKPKNVVEENEIMFNSQNTQ